jgi:hypothetical protein
VANTVNVIINILFNIRERTIFEGWLQKVLLLEKIREGLSGKMEWEEGMRGQGIGDHDHGRMIG